MRTCRCLREGVSLFGLNEAIASLPETPCREAASVPLVSVSSPVVGTQAQGPDSPGITVCPPHAGETRGGAAFLLPGGAPKRHRTEHRDPCTLGHSRHGARRLPWLAALAAQGGPGGVSLHIQTSPLLGLREQSSSQ